MKTKLKMMKKLLKMKKKEKDKNTVDEDVPPLETADVSAMEDVD